MSQVALFTNARIVNERLSDVSATDHAPHTPEEQACHARERATWVNGIQRYRDGQILEGPNGMALEFQR